MGDSGRGGRKRFEGSSSDSVCFFVVEAIAEVLETPAVDLPPLTGTIDTDAISALVSSATLESNATLTFVYEGVVVTITPEFVEVRPAEADDSR